MKGLAVVLACVLALGVCGAASADDGGGRLLEAGWIAQWHGTLTAWEAVLGLLASGRLERDSVVVEVTDVEQVGEHVIYGLSVTYRLASQEAAWLFYRCNGTMRLEGPVERGYYRIEPQMMLTDRMTNSETPTLEYWLVKERNPDGEVLAASEKVPLEMP